MNEPFCSVYSKSYRPFKIDPKIGYVKPCIFYEDLEENFIPIKESKVSYNEQRNDSIIRKLHIKRLVSTYQASYCNKGGQNTEAIDPNSLEADQFMVYFNKLYGPKKEMVLGPLDTFRTVHGYGRYQRYYTGFSVYQDEIGRQAYKYFKKDFDRGKMRLFGKKQGELVLREGVNVLVEFKCGNDGFKPKIRKKVTEEEVAEEMKRTEEEAKVEKEKNICGCSKEKICVICLKKYGDFSDDVPNKKCGEC